MKTSLFLALALLGPAVATRAQAPPVVCPAPALADMSGAAPFGNGTPAAQSATSSGVGHFRSKNNTGRIVYNMLATTCTTGCANGYAGVNGPGFNL